MVSDPTKTFLIDGPKKVSESKNIIKTKEEIDKSKVEVDKHPVLALPLEAEWSAGKKTSEIHVGHTLED